jgi:AbrB family looped-hinge helix DNA binding protein
MQRNLDELGRIVIPKEMRKKLNIENGDPVNIECTGNEVIITKPDTVDYKAIVEEAIKYTKQLREKYFRMCVAGSNEDLSDLIEILNGKTN